MSSEGVLSTGIEYGNVSHFRLKGPYAKFKDSSQTFSEKINHDFTMKQKFGAKQLT